MARRNTAATRSADAANTLAALGDSTRLGLLMRLCDRGPLSIAELTDQAHVTRQAVSKHLRALQRGGLAHSVRIGRTCVWRIEHSRINDMCYYLNMLSSQWDEYLERLRLCVEAKRH